MTEPIIDTKSGAVGINEPNMTEPIIDTKSGAVGINKQNMTEPIIDTKSGAVGVNEPLISPVAGPGSPSSKVIKTGRLYQFSTRERATGNLIFGNVFEIGYQRESDDLIVIRKKLWAEINRYEKDREKFKKEYAIDEIITAAIQNIKNLYIWKLEPITEKGITYIRKIKICNSEELLKSYEGGENAKKPE